MNDLSTMGKRQLLERKRHLTLELEDARLKLDKTGTSHILHLLLSLISGGLWLLPWLIISASNGSQRKALEKQISVKRAQILGIEDQIDML